MGMLGVASCSDNVDGELKPTANERLLQLSAEGQSTSDNGRDQAIKLNDLGAGSTEIKVNVTCNTLWKVEVSGNSGWCSVDVARGEGNGEFTIAINNNRGADRHCTVSVSQIDNEGNDYNKDGNVAEIDIAQVGSEVYITPSSLDMFPAENPKDQEFDIVANAEWTLSVRAEGETTVNFITISPIEGMTEVTGGSQVFTGTADARFRISLQNNGSAVVRKAYIELKSENGNYTVEISQQKSQYTFDVNPNTTRYIGPAEKSVHFDVYSPEYGWHIIMPENEKWITCQTTQFDKNDRRVDVNMDVQPNFSGRERYATIIFESDYNAYERVPVMVVQSGYDITFAISDEAASSVVMEDGGTIGFDLNSRFNWTMETPTWITANVNSGNASVSSREISLTVAANTTNNNRNGEVKIYPQPTNSSDGVMLDPEVIGVSPIIFYVTQFGGREPAVSVPWLVDSYTQTSATVEFNFYSPFYEVVEAGLRWSREGGSAADSMTVNPSDSKDCRVTFDMTGLDPATRYIAQGFVRYVKDGQVKEKLGNWSYPFSTAGRYPDKDDNPTPAD